jgi:hypothetical protein
MRCPSCAAEIVDESPSFCPRCGTALTASTEGEATRELSAPPSEVDSDAPPTTENAAAEPDLAHPAEAEPESGAPPDGGTVPIEEPPAQSPPTARPPLVRDFLASLRRAARREGLVDIVGAGGFSFLVLVACGAVLVLAAKLQYASLGNDSGSFELLSAVVIVALGSLRVPIAIGELTVSALPLGVLLLTGWAMTWAAARVVRRGGAAGRRAQVLDGMKVAVPFALCCWIAALVFRIRTEPTPVAAGAWGALLIPAVWGALFGALGGMRASKPLRRHATDAMRRLRERHSIFYEGVGAAGMMLGLTIGLALFAAVLWIIAGLLEGRPAGDFGPAQAGAALIYLLAFGPNVIVSIITVSLGAPVEVGAQISSSGRMLGRLEEISLFDWGVSGPPWYAFALLAIPVLSCVLAGFAARRNARVPGDVVQILALAAGVYALVLFEFAGLAEARLGAGLIRARGFGRVAPDAASVLLLAFAWAVVAGFVGWRIGDAREGDDASAPEPSTGGERDPEP